MVKAALIEKRFGELAEQMKTLLATKFHKATDYYSGDFVDPQMLLSWKVKARNLLSIACGVNAEHYKQLAAVKGPDMYRTNYQECLDLSAVFQAAQEDYEGGYLTSLRSLLEAEVFSTELEQASELLRGRYKSASAVIAGVVLETALRRLCEDASLITGKLDRMNADLAKAGVYSILVQKRITALADIRNNAAHGHADQFNERDVADMIAYVESFIAGHL